MAFLPAQEAQIEQTITKKSFTKSDWKQVKSPEPLETNTWYVNKIASQIPHSNLKVAIDPGGGATCLTSPQLLSSIGCDTFPINSDLDPQFSCRPSEPAEPNLSALKQTVTKNKADFGAAHDGDGDRLAIIDEKANFVPQDKLLSLLAKHYGGKTCVPINTSQSIDDTIGPENVIRTRVGDVAVAESLLKNKANFGGESSGCFIHPKIHLCPDGALSAAIVAHLISEHGPLSKQLAAIPDYHTLKESLPLKTDPQTFLTNLSSATSKYPNQTGIDGIRVQKENGWFLIRPSGTEPIIRITAESKDLKAAKSLISEARGLIKQ